MIELLKGFLGKNTDPYSRISSAVISIAILFLIFSNTLQKFNIYLFLFLGFHLLNHLVSGLNDSKKYVCYKCGKSLLIESYSFKKHKCKNKY